MGFYHNCCYARTSYIEPRACSAKRRAQLAPLVGAEDEYRRPPPAWQGNEPWSRHAGSHAALAPVDVRGMARIVRLGPPGDTLASGSGQVWSAWGHVACRTWRTTDKFDKVRTDRLRTYQYALSKWCRCLVAGCAANAAGSCEICSGHARVFLSVKAILWAPRQSAPGPCVGLGDVGGWADIRRVARQAGPEWALQARICTLPSARTWR